MSRSCVSAARTSERCSPDSLGTSPSTTNSSTPSSSPKEHELAAGEAVANGAQPPTVRERTAYDGQLADSFLEEFRRYADNLTPGHPFEQLNEELKQAVRDYEEHPDDVYTLDEVKAELGLD